VADREALRQQLVTTARTSHDRITDAMN